jgi:hypothetical protein
MCLNTPFRYIQVAEITTHGIVFMEKGLKTLQPGEMVIIGSDVILDTAWEKEDDPECA